MHLLEQPHWSLLLSFLRSETTITARTAELSIIPNSIKLEAQLQWAAHNTTMFNLYYYMRIYSTPRSQILKSSRLKSCQFLWYHTRCGTASPLWLYQTQTYLGTAAMGDKVLIYPKKLRDTPASQHHFRNKTSSWHYNSPLQSAIS